MLTFRDTDEEGNIEERSAFLFVIEGVDGVGKSTFIKKLQKTLIQNDPSYFVYATHAFTGFAKGFIKSILESDDPSPYIKDGITTKYYDIAVGAAFSETMGNLEEKVLDSRHQHLDREMESRDHPDIILTDRWMMSHKIYTGRDLFEDKPQSEKERFMDDIDGTIILQATEKSEQQFFRKSHDHMENTSQALYRKRNDAYKQWARTTDQNVLLLNAFDDRKNLFKSEVFVKRVLENSSKK